MRKSMVIDSRKVEKALIFFLKNEFKKRGYKKAVFGLSGGIDSSVVAFLLKNALGAKCVNAIFMPYKTTGETSYRDYKRTVKLLNVQSQVIPITPLVDPYFRKFPKADRVRRGNKMARERMSILYDQSKKLNALVVGSGNRTEILLGYATLHGDTACAVNPVGGLYKTQLRQLALHLGVPESIVWKVPTADLWPGQSDEDELGSSYSEIDKILFLAVDKGYKAAKLQQLGFSKIRILKILKRVERFGYKRELPEVAKL